MATIHEIVEVFNSMIFTEKEVEEKEDDTFEDIMEGIRKEVEGSSRVSTKENKHLETAVKLSSENPNLSFLNLDANDITLITEQFSYFVKGRVQRLGFDDFLKYPKFESLSMSQKIDIFLSFMERGILIPSGRRSGGYMRVNVPDMTIYLSSYMKSVLLGDDVHSALMKIISDEEFKRNPAMTPVIDYLDALITYNGDTQESDISRGYIFGHYFRILWEKINSFETDHPLRQFIAEHKMDYTDFFSVVLVYLYEMRDSRIDMDGLINTFAINGVEGREMFKEFHARYSNKGTKQYFEGGRGFMRSGCLELTSDMESQIEDMTTILISKEDDPDAKLMSFLDRAGRIFSLIDVNHSLEDLVLNEDEQALLQDTITRLKEPEKYDLSIWGLAAASLSSDEDIINSCSMLLYGCPGTGKTLSAGVIAGELGRKLIKIETSALRNKYYGQTEINIKRMFSYIRKINEEIKPAPVFLLNEADQILHERSTSIDGATTPVENAIQNIFLEELETLPGVFIATTNLSEYFDEAFFRRFDFKIEYKRPEKEAAAKIWKVHLKDSIPGAAEIDCDYLGKKYTFTGGVIRLVVQNACSRSMLRGEDAKLTLEDIEIFAKLEGMKAEPTARRVGFQSNSQNITEKFGGK